MARAGRATRSSCCRSPATSAATRCAPWATPPSVPCARWCRPSAPRSTATLPSAAAPSRSAASSPDRSLALPTVTINDRAVEVAAGTNLIEAGQKVGVQIPHYCYHPRLSVVGQCRMCLVEIEVGGETMTKLQTACSTQVERDGMVVRTGTPEVAEAVKGMMEFLLINHPLDCPICDQAGECGLQDYSFKHGMAFSRFQFEDKRTYPGRER